MPPVPNPDRLWVWALVPTSDGSAEITKTPFSRCRTLICTYFQTAWGAWHRVKLQAALPWKPSRHTTGTLAPTHRWLSLESESREPAKHQTAWPAESSWRIELSTKSRGKQRIIEKWAPPW